MDKVSAAHSTNLPLGGNRRGNLWGGNQRSSVPSPHHRLGV